MRIGSDAFKGCWSLVRVSLPDSLTTIDRNPFTDCRSLTEIDISPEHPVFTVVDGVLFSREDSALICYPGGRTEGIYEAPAGTTSIGVDAFMDCTKLNAVILPEGIASIEEYAFFGCRALTCVSLPEGLISIGCWAFEGCESLSDITLPESLTYIGDRAFYHCSALVNVTLPGGIGSVSDSLFGWCSALESVTMKEGVTAIGAGAFEYCQQLSYVVLPVDLTTIGERAFYFCSNLSDIALPETLVSIGNEAFSCCRLSDIALPEGLEAIGDGAFYGCNMAEVILPDSLLTLGNLAFEACRRLTTISLPDSLVAIGTNPFQGCTALTSFIISLEHSMYAFEDGMLISKEDRRLIAYFCSEEQTSVMIPDGISIIGSEAFVSRMELTDIALPESIVSIEESAFGRYTDNLLVTVPRGSVGEAFCKESGIRYSYPDGPTFLYNVQADGTAEITGVNGNVTELHIPATVDGYQVSAIARRAFEENTQITSVTIPGSVATIGNNAFSRCPSLTTVVLGEGVTTMQQAFNGCESLSSVTLPASLTCSRRGCYIFQKCSEALVFTVVSGSSAEEWCQDNDYAHISITLEE